MPPLYSIANAERNLDTARKAAGILKAELQFRGMRPQAAAEIDERRGVRLAEALLGQATERKTSHNILHKSDKLAKPTK